ncbi:MAG: hypothetical protein IJP13_06690 [Lachnospiraceae bacterium]|nr:hypothetical protein [Lachnospiraceae bacterium]
MRKKGFAKGCLTVAISTICLFGCSRDEGADIKTSIFDQESYAGESGTEEQHTTELPISVGSFDPSDVCKNISINGKIVEFPWTLNKLGDEYKYVNITNEVKEDGVSAAYLYHGDENKIMVAIASESVNRDSMIVDISFKTTDDISVYNLDNGTSTTDVIKVLGYPTEIKEDQIYDCRYIYQSDEMIIRFTFYDDKLVTTHISMDENSISN